MNGLRRVRLGIRDRTGIEVRRVPRAARSATEPRRTASGRPLSKATTIFDVDDRFHALYARGEELSESGGTNAAERGWHLTQFLDMTRGVGGLVAECGFFRGLSAWIMCNYLRAEDPSFAGGGFHVFDSFEGLSEPTPQDRIDDPTIPEGGVVRAAGLFSAPLEHGTRMLSDFPATSFHKGWIPDVLDQAPPGPYRLVHVDVDLYEPTRDSVAFFYPRLAPGGVIVCDDYGFIRWPGAKEAVDRFAENTGARVLRLASGQAAIFAACAT